MSKIWVGPVGSVSKGHVLDVNQKLFNQALKDYDSQLYTKWNPKKIKGHGCWEIRRRPNLKDVTHVLEFEGNTIQYIDYVEFDMVSHVLDCAFLNYDQLRKIKEMDTFSEGQAAGYADRLESREKSHREAHDAASRERLRYAGKHYRREMKDFKEMIRGGLNPALMMKYWK